MIENLLIKHAQQWPDKPALYFNSEFLTWKQLEEQTRKMARRIGDQYKRVALITTNNIEAYKIILALIYNGTEIVFLNRRLSIDELNYQIEDSNPELILIDNNFYDDGLKGNVLSFKNIPQVLQDNFYKGPAEITSIMYTSGTTGKPKGVMQSNINHYESALNSQKNLNTTKDDVWLLVSPIFHISGFSTIMKSLF
jgi:O-succinylbenzoic acid--CoA ligase